MAQGKVRVSHDLVFVDKKVIGRIERGFFTQRITNNHIFRIFNAKGIDVNVYERLKNECHSWRLIHKQTKQILSIPFSKIPIVAERRPTGSGIQYLVRLSDFNEDQPVLQAALL
jgi:hypothetical protein